MNDYDLDRFPPRGTKYKWHPPTWRGCPYTSDVGPKVLGRYIELCCSRDERGFFGYLTFNPFSGKKRVRRRTRRYQTALSACRAIERIADALLKQDTKPWMAQARKLGWRPPYRGD